MAEDTEQTPEEQKPPSIPETGDAQDETKSVESARNEESQHGEGSEGGGTDEFGAIQENGDELSEDAAALKEELDKIKVEPPQIQ